MMSLEKGFIYDLRLIDYSMLFLGFLAFHLLLQRFWKWFTVVNALKINSQKHPN